MNHTIQYLSTMVLAVAGTVLAAAQTSKNASTACDSAAYRADTAVAPCAKDGLRLVWHDEFDGTGKPDSAKWKYETGFCRNHEDQWYNGDKNVYLNGSGALVIEARRETVQNQAYKEGCRDWTKARKEACYTSGSMQSKFTYKYGKVEVRAKITAARGAWPAIWQVGTMWEWPLSGEIDIMEYYPANGVPSILANYCWGSDKRYDGRWQAKTIPLSHFTERDRDWINKYHVWVLDWDENSLRIYLDGEMLNEVYTSATKNGTGGYPDAAGAGLNPFSNDVTDFGNLIWLNLALGGDNGGEIDDDAFPMRYYVDYVRVYQK